MPIHATLDGLQQELAPFYSEIVRMRTESEAGIRQPAARFLYFFHTDRHTFPRRSRLPDRLRPPKIQSGALPFSLELREVREAIGKLEPKSAPRPAPKPYVPSLAMQRKKKRR